MIGNSQPMQEIKRYLKQVAAADCNVLLTGETGTGKELAARVIHDNSPRHQHPFVGINCAALPDNLLESELFGHEKGAFTGAGARFVGRLKLAQGGTVFLDEIGEMSPYSQAKILRAIETKEVYSLGSTRATPLDVRIIAATNQELEQQISDNRFRKDLFFRLNVARIHLPPLRERAEDIPLLLSHYLADFTHRLGRTSEGFSEDTLRSLCTYPWPGNVRELKNLLEAIFITAPTGSIRIQDLPEPYRTHCTQQQPAPALERERLLSVLLSTNWNKSEAARELRWSRMTLYRKLAKYRIDESAHLAPENDRIDAPECNAVSAVSGRCDTAV